MRLYSVLAATQSLIAIAQFLNQGSLGLYKLGETHLSPLILGVAKIVSGGTTYIRGAGTFPHPNPLSAFLILGVLASLYLFFASESKKYRIFYILLVISNIFGVVVTFSRGAYLALVTSLVLFFGLLIYRFLISNPAKSGFFRKTLLLAVTVTGVSLIVSFLCFRPFLMDRATFSDQSTMDRRSYDYGGIEMMKKNPIFGVGMGESVLHMEQALQKPLQPWDKQPPHNFFILAGAELGVPTMLLLVWIFLSHLIKIVKKTQSAINFESFSYYSVLVTSLIVILLLMQFDHYFYTIQQTQLLLWVILALTASQPGQKFSNNNI